MWDTVRRQLREQHRLERALPPLRATSAPDPCPLSATQRRLWHLDRATSGGRLAYNVTSAVRLFGDLDLGALRSAVDGVVRRHAALRMAFGRVSAGPSQTAKATIGDRLDVVDLIGDDDDAVDRWLADAAARRFDLAEGAPFHVSVCRRGRADHVMLASGHHIVVDGRSVNVVLWELGRCYTSHVLGRPNELSTPTLQLHDFVRWQRGWLASAAGGRYESFWRHVLDAPAFAHQSRRTRARPASGDYSGGRVECAIPHATVTRVGALAAEVAVSPISVYLAAYQALVHHYTGERYIATGIPAANRGRAELAEVVGFLVNVLPIPSEATPTRTLREASSLADEMVAAAYVHQAMPVEHVASQALAALDPADLPIDTFFAAYRQVVTDPMAMHGLTIGGWPSPRRKDTESPIMLTVLAMGTDVTAILSYGLWLLADDEAADLVSAYTELLDLATASPDTPMRRLITATAPW